MIDAILYGLLAAIVVLSAVRLLNGLLFHAGAFAHSKQRQEETAKLVEAWDKQAKKYDFYFDKANSKGVLLPDRTRHYDGTPRYKSEDD